MAKIVKKGKYAYHDESKKSKKALKKEREKELKKKLKQQDKALKKQCDCNHIDSNKGKSHFKYSKDNKIRTCKICGGQIINDPQLLNKKSVENAALTIYSVFAYARARLRLDEETDRQITKTLLMVSRCPDLLELIIDTGKSKKEKKKDKKNKKKNKNNFNRISY